MKFTPLMFISAAAASVAYGDDWSAPPVKPSSSSAVYYDPPASSSAPYYPKSSSSVYAYPKSSSSAVYYYPSSSAKASSSSVKKSFVYTTKTITSTIYTDLCKTVTESSTVKTYTTKVPVTTTYVITVTPSASPSLPVKALVPATCSDYTTTYTVTVTGGSKPSAPVSLPVKPVYPSGPASGYKPSGTAPISYGTGSPVKPYTQFTGAASNVQAGVLAAGAGALAALLL
ncbi:hypothetical protein EJ06DRAFT_556526 [Trichodelitschia bisporula]|uniref:Uncharacterized protein n=1 Tax=Trichodelitschia bisporula TaxID=703511 RepID=A0A6G1HWH3_9PEZI|nr:hypothetical protein EJ06DRAFT_556526 [Trichodelitschia bisporula]